MAWQWKPRIRWLWSWYGLYAKGTHIILTKHAGLIYYGWYVLFLNSPRVTISHRTTPNDHLVRLTKRKYQWWRCLEWFRGPEWQLANRQKCETVDIPLWFTLCPSVGPVLPKYKKEINRNGTSVKRNDSIPFHFCSCQYIAMSLHFISVQERGLAGNFRQGSADQRAKPITNFRPSLKKKSFLEFLFLSRQNGKNTLPFTERVTPI